MASIGAAQVTLLKDKYLKAFQGNDQRMPIIEGMLAEYAKAFISNAQNNINKKGMTAKGNLADDLTFQITENGSSVVINIGYPAESVAADYYDFQNKGVAGVGKSIASPYAFKTLYPSRKMVSEIAEWLKLGKMQSRNDDQKYSLSTLQSKRKSMTDLNEQRAYGVARGIKRKGITPTYFFDDAITQTFDKNFLNIVGKALNADVSIKIIKYGDNN